MKAVKQFEVLEEGFCKVTLSSKKAYDPYMLSLIEKEHCALSCRNKGQSTTIFYYDICEQIPLLTLLSIYEFTEKEACACLERLFEDIERMDHEYPLLIRADSIYYDPVKQSFSFVILPVHERDFEHDYSSLLSDIAANLNLCKEAFYGFLCDMMTQQSSPSQIVQRCHVWQQQHTAWKRIRLWWQRFRYRNERKKQNEHRLQEELTRLRFIRRSANREVSRSEQNRRQTSDTVVLFPSGSACLKDLRGNIYPLQNETHIGRNAQNDIVIDLATVSANHALIKQSAQGMVLVDLGSSNGTKVNNKKLKKHRETLLKNKDTILFADSCWYYEEDSL